jgi:hypothetical protein
MLGCTRQPSQPCIPHSSRHLLQGCCCKCVPCAALSSSCAQHIIQLPCFRALRPHFLPLTYSWLLCCFAPQAGAGGHCHLPPQCPGPAHVGPGACRQPQQQHGSSRQGGRCLQAGRGAGERSSWGAWGHVGDRRRGGSSEFCLCMRVLDRVLCCEGQQQSCNCG